MNAVSKLAGRAVLVFSALGLVVALAGSAVAGSLITGRQIKDGTIASVDVRDGSLRGVDVKDASLTRTDFGALPAGAAGAQGARGVHGPDGVQGVVRQQKSATISGLDAAGIDVDCPPNTYAVGGGVRSTVPANLYVEWSAPTTQGWTAFVLNVKPLSILTATVVAVCASN